MLFHTCCSSGLQWGLTFRSHSGRVQVRMADAPAYTTRRSTQRIPNPACFSTGIRKAC